MVRRPVMVTVVMAVVAAITVVMMVAGAQPQQAQRCNDGYG